jgi:O-antigen/teichoic acid export membrane protein
LLKKIISGSLIYGLAPYVPRLVSIALLPFLTSHLSATDFGVIGVVTAYTSSIAVFSTLGFLNLLYNTFYQYGNRYVVAWKRIYGILLLWGIIFIILQTIFFYLLIPKEVSTNRFILILLIIFGTLFTETSLIGNAYYQLNLKPVPIAIRTIISGLILISTNYYLVVYQNAGYMGYFIAFALSNFIINVSYFRLVLFKLKILPTIKIKKIVVCKYLKVILPTIPHYYSTFLLNSSNRIVMDKSGLSMNSIGQINIAQQFFNIIDSLFIAVNQSITPIAFAEIKKENHQNIKFIVNNFYFLTIVITFCFSIWSKEVFYLLIKNDSIRSSYVYLIVLIMSLNYKPFYLLNSYYYFYHQQTLSILKITLVSGIIALIGYIALIPFYGLWGFVIVYFVTMLYMGFIGFYFEFYKSYCNIKFNLSFRIILPIGLTILALKIVELKWVDKLFYSLIFLSISGYTYFKYNFYDFKKISI